MNIRRSGHARSASLIADRGYTDRRSRNCGRVDRCAEAVPRLEAPMRPARGITKRLARRITSTAAAGYPVERINSAIKRVTRAN